MITVSNLEKTFGGNPLFEHATFELKGARRYGLVGANGSGKTTLLKIMAGRDTATDGDITYSAHLKIGVLEQDRFRSDAQSIIDVAMMGDLDAFEAIEKKEAELLKPQPSANVIADLEDRIAATDGYTLEARSGAVLEGLGIPSRRHGEPLSALSGGFKLRVLLAQTLIGAPDLLLLDEPTNHLDILTIDWLESFLARYAGCVVVISHDQRFLDVVTTHTLDVDYRTVTLYTGNYTQFLKEKEETRVRRETERQRQEEVIAEKRAFVERFRAKATKARQAQSRAKQLEKIVANLVELPTSSRQAPMFAFDQQRPSGKEVLTIESLHKSYDHPVLQNVNLKVRRGDKVAIIGGNGMGKSTLLKVACEKIAADSGECTWGYETHIGYFAQDHQDILDEPELSVLEALWRLCPGESTSFVRGQLGRMLFSGDDVDKRVAALSGGEAARLVFARLIVARPNVLVLDEPTNHLDLESIEALATELKKFEGTLLFVSHDRHFVARLATRIIEVKSDGVQVYDGNYNDYLSRQGGADHLDNTSVVETAQKHRSNVRQEQKETPTLSTAQSSWENQKKLRNLEKARGKITAKIEAAESRQREIQALYCVAGFFEDTPAAKVESLAQEDKKLQSDVASHMEKWEQLEEEIEDLTNT